MESSVALIDGDVLVFRAAWKAERTFDWGDGHYSIVADLNEAIQYFELMLSDVLRGSRCGHYLLAMSDGAGIFRNELYPDYKKGRHRFGVRKPMVFKTLRDAILKNEIDSVMLPGLEGDDVMGIHQTDWTVICTIDKDLKTIPGQHYNFDKDEAFTVSEMEADMFHMMQTCAGDSTDGIPGIPGIGPKKATSWLDKNGWTWNSVLALFDKNGLGEEYCTLQARLTRILREGEWDDRNKTPILFTPDYS